MRENFAASRKQIGELNSQIEDSLLGIRVVKSFAQELKIDGVDLSNAKYHVTNACCRKMSYTVATGCTVPS
jgi:ABC-type multidrug transport system fused ATPase/permease subunit